MGYNYPEFISNVKDKIFDEIGFAIRELAQGKEGDYYVLVPLVSGNAGIYYAGEEFLELLGEKIVPVTDEWHYEAVNRAMDRLNNDLAELYRTFENDCGGVYILENFDDYDEFAVDLDNFVLGVDYNEFDGGIDIMLYKVEKF